jgi:hypothetical protein
LGVAGVDSQAKYLGGFINSLGFIASTWQGHPMSRVSMMMRASGGKLSSPKPADCQRDANHTAEFGTTICWNVLVNPTTNS